MTKKNINKMFSSVINKNLNWEISTKNSVTFKRWVKDGKFNIMGGHWKIRFLGGCMKNQYIALKGRLDKKDGVDVFWGGVETLMHTMSWMSLLINTNIQSK